MFILDRIEGNMAVIEWDNEIFSIPLALLPQDAKEGDCLTIDIKLDKESTEGRRERIKEKASRLWE